MKRTLIFMFLLVGMMGLVSAGLTDNIRSYYTLNETSNPLGDVVSGLDATGSGTNFLFAQAGIVNGSIYGDPGGVNSQVILPITYGVFTDGEYSVSFWAKFGATETLAESISFKGEANTYINRNSDGNLYWEVNGGNSISATYPTGTWTHFVLTSNATGRTFYKNGAIASSTSLTTPSSNSGTSQLGFKDGGGYWDEIGIWDRALTDGEVSALYSGGSGNTYPFGTAVVLNSPADNYVSPITSIEFNATAFSGVTLVNMTLYHNAGGSWTAIETKSLSGEEDTETFTDTFSDGDSFTWNIEACDTNSLCVFGGNNRTALVDLSPPTIEINSPVNNSLLSELQEKDLNQSIDITILDDILDSCWYVYNGINTTFGTGGTCNDFNLTLKNVETLPYHELTIYANDTLGHINSSSTRWEYDAFVSNQTWNNETQEGAVESFELNLTLGTGLTFNSATLIYNGTEYSGTITNTAGSEYNVSRTISISNVVGTQNHEFYWNLALSNGEEYNTTTQQQQAVELFIDDCSSYNTMILNYTLYDEETQLLIPSDENTTIAVNIDISPVGTTTPIIEFSKQFVGNNATICLDDLEGDYRMDVITKYSAFDYVVEYHHIQNFDLSTGNIPQHISLYDLAVTESQEFLVVVKDENFLLVPDALVDVSREYVSEGQFKSVEVAKTDSQGQTIVHLVLSDVRYTIVVKKEGTILASFDNVVAVCQDAGSGECTLNLNELASQVPPDNYENKGNINYYWTLDRDARTIQLDFTTIAGVSTIGLNVTKFDNFFNSTACSETLTSTTGTITCAVAETFGNTTFIAEVYSDGQFISQAMFSLSPNALESFGYAGVIMVIIMFMVLPLMFISSPVGMVFGAIIAVIMMGMMQLFDGGGILGTSSAIIWFIIAGLILVWRISKGGNV